MDEIARVYADALFQAAKKAGKLDAIREQLGRIVDAIESNRELQVFFFSPNLSSADKKDGIERAISGAEPELINFLELLIEKHRMPVIFHVRRQIDEKWAEENRRLEVTLTSAVELDPEVVRRVGEEIERKTDREVELRTRVDENTIGGLILQVGNMVLDASIRNRLEQLRKEVAHAA